ncbi:MAG: pyridoxal phosphate-dependent aminotransferase [Prevotella sp.]|nr:pyridoxal phosphate-dependent aminotransferase [Prevotella sp.]
MKYNFDELVERRGTNCVKWDESPSADVIPLWVADMDFRVAPAIQKALQQRVEHGVFGYNIVPESYYEAVISWFRRRHQWEIQRQWILYTTAVVPAMSCVIKALTMPGEKVLILSPAYNCFFSSIRNNGCEVLESPLRLISPPELGGVGGGLNERHPSFEIDWQDFEAKCADEKTTLFLLCNPHNPTGRVWTKEELQRMYDICKKHGVKVVSDEIHCELVMPGYEFVPLGTITDDCVVMNSPSKNFNTAGLQIANIICSHPSWRRRIDRAININEVCDVNPFGIVALQAAYNESEDWIDELNQYLWGNYQVLCVFIDKNLPQWKVCRLEGTYLPWVDVSAMGIPVETLCQRLLQEAKVWINPGTMYGPETGKGYVRFNIATQRNRLVEALERIQKELCPK